MSDTPGTGGAPANGLQFDRVEYTAPVPAAACRFCGQEMRDVYYEVNGQPLCENCRQQVEQLRSGGSASGRFARAALFGSLAGLVGAAIFYGVREGTGYNFGLISIVVGVIVGKAVKKGSDARGGWFYQALAIFITYTAIVLTYIPPIIQSIRNAHDEKVAAAAQKEEKAGEAAEAVDGADAAAAAPDDAGARPRPSIGGLLLAVVVLMGLAYALPVMLGIDSPMGLFIIGFGLYEAWAINRRAPLVINGPYQIGRAGSGDGVHVEPAG
jgi:hypothetical protein